MVFIKLKLVYGNTIVGIGIVISLNFLYQNSFENVF